MNDLYEEIKQDKVKDIILTVITFLFIIAAVGMISVGLYTWYQVHQRNKAQMQSEVMEQAMTQLEQIKAQGGEPPSLETLKQLAEQSGAYPSLSKFYLAKIYQGRGQKSAAILEYKQLAEDNKLEPAIRNLAALKFVSAKLMDGKATLDEAQQDLAKYFPEASAEAGAQMPFYHAATLLKAILAFHNKQIAVAEKKMQELKDYKQKYGETIQLTDKVMQEYIAYHSKQVEKPKDKVEAVGSSKQ